MEEIQMPTKILIDSGSDINKFEAEKLGVILLPIEVNFGGETYMDGDTILAHEFYEKLESVKELPKTSQINNYRFNEEFTKHTADGSDIVYLSLSSRISGTYNNARLTAEDFNGKVCVVDTLNASTGMRVLVEYAIRLRDQGLNASKIAEELEKVKSKVRVVAMIDTLKYLKMGGRISGAAALIGGMLSIKPMIGVIEGEIKVIGKCVGAKKAFAYIIDQVKKEGVDLSMPHAYINSGNDLSNYNSFITTTEEIYGADHLSIAGHTLGATIGTHIGSGAVGVAYFAK